MTVSFDGHPRATWPHRVGAVPALADCRVDRTSDSILNDALASAGKVPCQVVAGLGGVGKTQLAAGLARRWWDEGRIDLLLWVNAGSRANVLTRYAQAAAGVTGVQDAEPMEAADRLLAWLLDTPVRWLIVLDDLTDHQTMRELWPPVTSSGRVIVTTRRRDAALLAGRQLVDVGLFTPPEADRYLRTKLRGQPDVAAEAEALAADLGYLPLALAQAAAYIVDQIGLTCGGYRERLARRRLADVAPESLPDDHSSVVAETWSLSIGLADRRSNGLATPVLELVALLDPNAIPVDLFTTTQVTDDCTAAVGHAVAGDDVIDVLRLLHRLSLVTLDGSGRSLRVHRLVQRVVREAARPDPARVVALADGLLERWPDIERDPVAAQLLRANALALLTNDAALWRDDGIHPIVFRIGRSFGAAGLATSARDHFDGMLDAIERRLGPDHPHTIAARYNAARWQGKAGDIAGATVALRQLLDDLLDMLRRHESHTSTDPGELAVFDGTTFWRADGQDWEGVSALVELVVRRQMGEIDAWLRNIDDRLGDVDFRLRFSQAVGLGMLSSRGIDPPGRSTARDPAEAAAMLHEILDDVRAVLDNMQRLSGLDLSGTRSTGTFLSDLGDRIAKVWGSNHPFTQMARGLFRGLPAEADDPIEASRAYVLVVGAAIGAVAHYLGTVAKSLVLFMGYVLAFAVILLAAPLVVWESSDPQILIVRHELACLIGELQGPVEAVIALQGVVNDMRRVLGPDAPATLTARGSLAHMIGRAGNPARAANAYRGLLADWTRVAGPEQLETLVARGNLALWSGEAGDPAGAVTALDEVVADMTRYLGPDSPVTLTARAIRADMLGRTGDRAAAVTAYRELLADRTRVLGPNHPDTLFTGECLAYWQSQAGP